MPIVATIRAARATLQYKGADNLTGAVNYPTISEIERRAGQEFSDSLRTKLGLDHKEPAAPAGKPKIVARPTLSPRSIEDQKAELRKRGFLA